MANWQPDRLLKGFEALELPLPDDYEGPGVATLVRLPAGDAPRGPVLYVHGFSDYFFQRHMAERFAAEGYAFHALDLRRCGRSYRPGQHPHFVRDLGEHYAELTAALGAIGAPVLLAGHSAGGLLCSLYAHEGERRDAVRALWLNSPFLHWNLPNPWWSFKLFVAETIGRRFPYAANRKALHPEYTRGLHADWEFDTQLKPLGGFPVFFGWARAITKAQRRVHRGLAIACPVLSMHSDEADIVLNWRDISRCSRLLGPKVTVLQFPGAVHDLVLSAPEIREAVFSALFSWAERALA
jgi:alpha-beta hydrolase superfamily lysophospholipase